jgi:GTPase SAR1 family protein
MLLQSDGADLHALVWSPDGRLLAAWGDEATIVWDVGARRQMGTFGGAESVTWAPDSRGCALLSGRQDKVTAIDLAPAASTERVLRLRDAKDLGVVSWHPGRQVLAGASRSEVRGLEYFLWEIEHGRLLWKHQARKVDTGLVDWPRHLVWSPDGRLLAANGNDCTVRVLNAEGKELACLQGHGNYIDGLAWSPDGSFLVSASNSDGTIRIWSTSTWTVANILERPPYVGYVGVRPICSLSPDGNLLALLRVEAGDDETPAWRAVGEIELWRVGAWDRLLEPERRDGVAMAFHPSRPLLATLLADGAVQLTAMGTDAALNTAPTTESAHYANARVVLVGDSGVGKSGLGLVLAGEPFAPTESTHGRRIWTFDSAEVELQDRRELREILLWDLAGQPGYRLVHQLYLDQADVALVVFDARSETDPFTGVSYWARALAQVEQLAGGRAQAIRKLLVAARTDRGTVAVNPGRVKDVVSALGLDAYFETSAKEGWGVAELAVAIHDAVDWDTIPRVTSTELFLSIKSFLKAEKETGRLLATPGELMASYMRQAVRQDLPEDGEGEARLLWQRLTARLLSRSQQADLTGAELLRRSLEGPGDGDQEKLLQLFDVCIGRVESQALIRRLSFGGQVLLQPELLDAYAAAIVNAARQEPDGLGSIAEERVLALSFPMSPGERVADPGQERLLLIATIEELLRREIALREQTEEGPQLVFPSVSTRDRPEFPTPPTESVVFAFDGPVTSIYATLVVRLSRSGQFRRREIWRTSVLFDAHTGGSCGLLSREDDDGHAELGLFYGDDTSEETRFNFEAYVEAHLERRAMTMRRWRVYTCPNPECREAISTSQAARRRERGFDFIRCPVCDTRISLLDREERLRMAPVSLVPEMDRAADAARDRAANVAVVEGKIATVDFDVFLCHNSDDKPAVKAIGQQLKDLGILPWLDEWELRPGLPWQAALEEQIEQIKSAAVFVGRDGIGPWQRQELDALLREFVDRGAPVIPVLLSDAPHKPDLPVFLRGMTWVDFRSPEPDPLARLQWGVTGQKPPERP